MLDDGTRKYTPGVSSRNGSTSTFQHSGLKNATEQSNSSQSTTATRKYDAFGNVQTSSGTWQGPFGYAGSFGYQEDGSGLKLLGHRYYDPSLGRFLTSDPIGDGSNWYAYCGNNPVGMADPTGEAGILLVVAVVAAVFFLSSGTAHAPTGAESPEDIARLNAESAGFKLKLALAALTIPDAAALGSLALGAAGARLALKKGLQSSAPLNAGELIALNKARGEAAERAFEAAMKKAGMRYQRRPYVPVKGFERGRFPDFAVLDDLNQVLYYVEVKSGGARYGGLQKAKDAVIEASGTPVIVIRL